jgi:hypothetical protein
MQLKNGFPVNQAQLDRPSSQCGCSKRLYQGLCHLDASHRNGLCRRRSRKLGAPPPPRRNTQSALPTPELPSFIRRDTLKRTRVMISSFFFFLPWPIMNPFSSKFQKSSGSMWLRWITSYNFLKMVQDEGFAQPLDPYPVTIVRSVFVWQDHAVLQDHWPAAVAAIERAIFQVEFHLSRKYESAQRLKAVRTEFPHRG